jgi:hypothetical protein
MLRFEPSASRRERKRRIHGRVRPHQRFTMHSLPQRYTKWAVFGCLKLNASPFLSVHDPLGQVSYQSTGGLAISFLAKPCHLECLSLAKALMVNDSEIMERSIRAGPTRLKQASSTICSQKSLNANRDVAATPNPEILGNGMGMSASRSEHETWPKVAAVSTR